MKQNILGLEKYERCKNFLFAFNWENSDWKLFQREKIFYSFWIEKKKNKQAGQFCIIEAEFLIGVSSFRRTHIITCPSFIHKIL